MPATRLPPSRQGNPRGERLLRGYNIPYPRSYPDVVRSQFPEHYWRFDDPTGAGTVVDQTGRHPGTPVGTVVQGRKGATYDDSGLAVSTVTDGRVTSTYNPFVNNQGFSFSGLVYLLGTGQYSIFGSDDVTNGINLRVESGTYPTNVSFANSVTNTFTGVWPGAYQWVHVGLTWDGAPASGSRVAKLYINGALASTLSSLTSSWPATPGNFEAFARRGAGIPLNGLANEYATWTAKVLSAEEMKAQYDAAWPPLDDQGGAAPAQLSVAPPTGYQSYTIRTVTAEESAADPSRVTTGPFDLLLNDSTDYWIKVPYTMRRGLRLRGGRNVVLLGGHAKIENQNRFNADIPSLYLADGAAPTDARIIHVEGWFAEGSDLGEGIDINAPAANVRLCYCRVENPHLRNSDAFGGTNMYQEGTNHPDVLQTFGDYKTLHVERCTGTHSVTSFHIDPGHDVRFRNSNARAVAYTTTEEGPYSDSLSFTATTTRYDYEAAISPWAAAGGSTVTRDTATPITGVGSMKLTQVTASANVYAVATGLGGVDWSEGNGLGCTARLDAGGGAHPMLRIDVATDAGATDSSQVGWHLGKSRKLNSGTPTTVFSDFPAGVLQAIQKVRVSLITDRVSATHTVMIDGFASGVGSVTNTFTGPQITYEGYWSLYKNDAATSNMFLDGFYSNGRANGLFVDNVNYYPRSWNGSAYVLNPPPGTAGQEDAILATTGGQPDTSGTDTTGAYVSWAATGEVLDSSASSPGRVYTGDPPGGDFATSAIAGGNYIPLSGIALPPDETVHTRAIYSPTVNPKLFPGLLTHTRGSFAPFAVSPQLLPAQLSHTRTSFTPKISPQILMAQIVHSRSSFAPVAVSPQILPAQLAHTRTQYGPTVSPQILPGQTAHTRAVSAPAVVTELFILPAQLAHTRAIYSPTISGGGGGTVLYTTDREHRAVLPLS